MFICLCVVITCIQVSHHISVFYECVWEFIILYTRIDIFVLIQLKRSVYKYIFILNLNIFFLTLSLSLSIFFFLCCSNNLLVFFLSSLFLFCLFLYKYIHIFDFTRYVKYMQMVNDSFLILSYIYIYTIYFTSRDYIWLFHFYIYTLLLYM